MAETRYSFFLAEEALAKCPKCQRDIKMIKIPIAIELNFGPSLYINKHCMFCKNCDLLIVSKNEINEPLNRLYEKRITKNDYRITGTISKWRWRLGMGCPENTIPFEKEVKLDE